jgi:hypothetical protein
VATKNFKVFNKKALNERFFIIRDLCINRDDWKKPMIIIKQAVCDRGYVGAKVELGANIILPKKALKRDNRYQRDKKRKLCKRRAAIGK